jgi:hypothetical protein
MFIKETAIVAEPIINNDKITGVLLNTAEMPGIT